MAMKRYIFTLALGVIISFTQCTMNEIDVNVTPSTDSGLHVIGAAADFDNHNVSTRSNEFSDSYITEMTMFIFKADGTLLQGYDGNKNPISSAINIPQSNPTFLIEARKYNGTGIISSMGASLNIKYFNNKENNLNACRIYIVANAYHHISHLIDGDVDNGEIQKLEDLNAAIVDIDATLSMPKDANRDYIGFPMIGHAVTPDDQVATFDLNYNAVTANNNAVANIPLVKLYSKVYFAMQINSNQIVANGTTPKFQIDRAEVYNVPTTARMGAYTDEYVNTSDSGYQFVAGQDDPFVIEGSAFSNEVIYHTSAKDIAIGLNSSDLIEFCFYMPEHKVLKNDINPYPANIDSQYKQYYKPKLVGAGNTGSGLAVNAKIATFVRIHGTYTDHNGRIKGVSYDIYLGQNNTDDFEVKRNQQLINRLIITGLTNHKDAYLGGETENISIDHRVTMTDRGYSVYMEREATLDSHFEVRPVDFELQNGSALTIVIPEECRSWIAMESDAVAHTTGKNSGLYVDVDNEKRGVRKYFTTNLVSELTNVAEHTITLTDGRKITTNDEAPGSIKLEHSSRLGGTNTNPEHFRIWFYVDENPNVYDKTGATSPNGGTNGYNVSKTLYRNAPVKLYYTNQATDNPDIDSEAVHTINFQQWNLWRVWAKDKEGNPVRYYDIEHEEEYLNNYASDMQYGGTQNGMPYGLEGIQLSKNVQAYWAEKVEHDTGSGLGASILEFIVGIMDSYLNFSGSSNSIFSKSGKEPYFDFYLSRDNFPVDKLDNDADVAKYARDYQGLQFNKEIAATLKASTDTKAKIDGITLTEDPQSAFAYCYHKNKRNPDGTIDINNIKWFLPAIDEIEDIALGAYDEFDKVFQNQKYWSCQPTYESNTVVINPIYYTWVLFGSTYIDYSKYITMEGEFFNENATRARATSIITTDGKTYQNINSGLPSDMLSGLLTVTAYIEGSRNGETITNWAQSDIDYSNAIFANPNGAYRGNSSRSEVNRIRAVYRSGTKPVAN